MRYDAIIIGAGLSGLVLAWRLTKSGRRVLLLESGERAGGVIESLECEGFLIERGPNSMRGTHELLDLVEELGLGGELITADRRAPAYIFFRNQLHPVPMGPFAALTTRLLSPGAKLRLLREPFIPPREDPTEESIASFVRRRLGPEALDRLISPFISGVFAGDVERLSVRAALPRLADFEAEMGSIARGIWQALRSRRKQPEEAPRRSLRDYRLCSFRRGLAELPAALARELGDRLRTGVQVARIAQLPLVGGPTIFEVEATKGDDQFIHYADSVILAAPADVAGRLLRDLSPRLGSLLNGVPYNSLISVPLAYRREQIKHRLDGFGFLAPRAEGLRTLGSIWNSSLFPGRAPSGWVLTTSFIGGETDPSAIGLTDEVLIRTAHTDLQRALGIVGEPRPLPLKRYNRAIPQYVIGHVERMLQISILLAEIEGLFLVGNYIGGVSIGDCIKNAIRLAGEVERKLKMSERVAIPGMA